jgi:predicted ArsR family transcriptional regulator
LTRVLGEAVQRLNDLNYKARWEAHSDAPHVLFYNCPYAAIVADHPELCRMDAALLEHLIGRPASLASRLGDQRGRAPYCLFLIHI